MGTTVFDLVLFAGLVLLLLFLFRSKIKHLLVASAGLTIALYRTVTFGAIYIFGLRFAPDVPVLFAKFDHKYLGATIVLLTLILGKRLSKKTRLIFLGVGAGMLIDEVSEILAFIPGLIPAGFRDSLPDLVLITAAFVLFVLIFRKTTHSVI